MNKMVFKNAVIKLILTALTLTSAAQAVEVELLEEFNISMSRYGQSWKTESFTVAVDNLGPGKQVFIYREKSDGSWVDIPMYYYAPAGNGKEIWKLTNTDGDWGDEFVVKMELNGAEFWDNNFGNNYRINSEGFLIGNAKEVAVKNWSVHELSPGVSRFFATIVVDNLGPTKNVELVYSFDGWETSVTLPASFNGSRPVFGYGSYPNPSQNNAEAWHVALDFPIDQQAEFFIKYSVNGEEYFDNNFGANYKINPTTAFGSMFLRMGPDWSDGMPMRAIGEYLWAANIQVNKPNGISAIKFDAFDDWSTNFGDNDADGMAELNGENISVPAPGSYRVLFNDQDLTYSFQAFGFRD